MKERQRWQPEEDALLRAYVKQYGPKEWNLISQRMGKSLDRDPKSCLERWKNYLKPGIKKGSLSLEEQNLVISLQAKYGNKWKKIASEVPGRTAKRLGKWWEVYKEKQMKKNNHHAPPVPGGASPEEAGQGKYDHILETFAEKYVQPKLFPSTIVVPVPVPAPVPEPPPPPPVLSLGSTEPEPVHYVLPPWMSTQATVTTSSLTSSSSNASPSVSLTLSPCDPDPVHQETTTRLIPGHHHCQQQVGMLIQYSKEVEEGRQNWVQHKKEATWRLSRLEQQLEAEKNRKRREKMEEIEGKIRRLREEEMEFVGRVEGECRERLRELEREAKEREAKLMEAWCNKHMKMVKLVEQIGVCSHGFAPLSTNEFHHRGI